MGLLLMAPFNNGISQYLYVAHACEITYDYYDVNVGQQNNNSQSFWQSSSVEFNWETRFET